MVYFENLLPKMLEIEAIIGIIATVLFQPILIEAKLPASASAQQLQQIKSDSVYHGREVLGCNGKYILEWFIDKPGKTVTFNVTVNTLGSLWLGFSINGELKNADIVIGGVLLNGNSYLVDMVADNNGQLLTDLQQDWVTLSATESNAWTSLVFSRRFDTSDLNDYPFTEDLLSIIWAFGESDNLEASESICKRGSFRVYLLDPILRSMEKSKKVWTMAHTLEIPGRETSYMCTIHKAPELTKKHHIVEYHTIISSEVDLKHLHHIIIWRCSAPLGVIAPLIFELSLGIPIPQCNLNFLIPVVLCKRFYGGWAIGGKSLILPKSTGIPFGDDDDQYYMLEAHYNNPDGKPKIVTARMDLHYTDQLRPKDGGFTFVGYDNYGLFMIPPNTLKFDVFGHCLPECTSTMIDETDDYAILTVLLHSHMSGIRMKLRHFRKGKELPYIIKDDNYDNTFQQTRHLDKPRRIKPGDQLTMECRYDNSWAVDETTIAGFSTRNEMCLAGILVTKPTLYAVCGSAVPEDVVLDLIGVKTVTWDVENQRRIVVMPLRLAGKSLPHVADDLTVWTQELRETTQRVQVSATQNSVCLSADIFMTAVTEEVLQDKSQSEIMELSQQVLTVTFAGSTVPAPMLFRTWTCFTIFCHFLSRSISKF